jgi:hypothetical protein
MRLVSLLEHDHFGKPAQAPADACYAHYVKAARAIRLSLVRFSVAR